MEIQRIKELILNDRSFPIFIENVEKALTEIHQNQDAAKTTTEQPSQAFSQKPAKKRKES